MDAPKDPAKELAAWRKEKGLSQAEAAALVPVSQAAWSHWEQGERVPGLNAARIEEITGGRVPVPLWPRTRKQSQYRRPRKRVEPEQPQTLAKGQAA